MQTLTSPPSNNQKAMETHSLVSILNCTCTSVFSLASCLLSALGTNKFNWDLLFLCSTCLTLELGPVCALPCVILPNTFRDVQYFEILQFLSLYLSQWCEHRSRGGILGCTILTVASAVSLNQCCSQLFLQSLYVFL